MVCQSLTSCCGHAVSVPQPRRTAAGSWTNGNSVAQPGGRRAARPAPTTRGQVGLVGVPARRGDSASEPAVRRQRRRGRLEAGDPLVLLRPEADLRADQRAQVAPAVADLVGHRGTGPPRVSRARPGPPRRAARAHRGAPAPRSGRRSTTSRAASRSQAVEPLRQVGELRRRFVEVDASRRPARRRAGPAARGPRRWSGRAGCRAAVRRGGSPPARRAGPRPSTSERTRRAAGPADVQRLVERQHERERWSTAARGARRRRRGRRRRPSSEVTYGARHDRGTGGHVRRRYRRSSELGGVEQRRRARRWSARAARRT